MFGIDQYFGASLLGETTSYIFPDVQVYLDPVAAQGFQSRSRIRLGCSAVRWGLNQPFFWAKIHQHVPSGSIWLFNIAMENHHF